MRDHFTIHQTPDSSLGRMKRSVYTEKSLELKSKEELEELYTATRVELAAKMAEKQDFLSRGLPETETKTATDQMNALIEGINGDLRILVEAMDKKGARNPNAQKK